MLKNVILNDLDSLSKIFNDTKHRAVSATAELLVKLQLQCYFCFNVFQMQISPICSKDEIFKFLIE